MNISNKLAIPYLVSDNIDYPAINKLIFKDILLSLFSK